MNVRPLDSLVCLAQGENLETLESLPGRVL
jgi:hypothetical protein